jgi:hypothetical protein
MELSMPQNEPTLQQLFNYGNLAVQKAHHQAYEQKQPDHNYTIECPTALVGIEVEIENVQTSIFPEFYWKEKEDGSLRNYGREYTSIPLRGNQIPYALDYLFNNLNINNKPECSTRCSTHVHLNVRDMTPNQVKSLVALYSLFEKHFFHIAGTKRETSIFCVPLYKSNIKKATISNILEITQYWPKYLALNLAPISGSNDVAKYGTIEFRHLYGTQDKAIIINWINNIFCLRKAAIQYDWETLREKIRTLNTSSEYYQLYSDVFGQYANMRLMHKYDFESCVSATKLWEFYKPHLTTKKSALFQAIHHENYTWPETIEPKKPIDELLTETVKNAIGTKPFTGWIQAKPFVTYGMTATTVTVDDFLEGN